MHFFSRPPVGILLLCAGVALSAPDGTQNRPRGTRPPAQESACNDVPAHPADLILGRPTRDSITASVLAYNDVNGFIEYGSRSGQYSAKTPVRPFEKGQPTDLVINALRPDMRYYYRFQSRSEDAGTFVAGPECTFHTQRPPGSTFTFTVTADSHLDEQTDCDLYARTLANALADHPNFHIDLGDTFMCDRHATREQAARQYLAQRYYFGLLVHSVPLYLVLGNHDGEEGRWLDGTTDNLALWSHAMRKRYFPNPVPDNFYTGGATRDRSVGLLQDYYAWEWGDALFVVLDPFWFTSRQRGRDDNWSRTLGGVQYQWLKRTLEQSKAEFKFVFIHHLVGGVGKDARGGAEAAGLYEWGGRNADGTEGFQERRPGWALPIHELLARNGVSIVFHGHDHLFARQDLDGIVYQEVPQPGHPGTDVRRAEDYGYASGIILGGSGHLRVTVSSEKTTVDFIRAHLPSRASGASKPSSVEQSYSVPAGPRRSP
jgi:hypothetical protein